MHDLPPPTRDARQPADPPETTLGAVEIDWGKYVGRVVGGRFRLRRLLGSGSYGGVFHADVLAEGERVASRAVKIFAPLLASHARPQAGETPAEAINRLRDQQLIELKLAMDLQFEHLLRCHTVGSLELEGATALYAEQELADESLADAISHGPLDARATADLARQVCQALQLLHTMDGNVVHRDVKPANVLRCGATWKLGDFGTVLGLGGLAQIDATARGTREYAPPECLELTTAAWDVWSLGVTLVEALSGQRPFRGTGKELVRAIATERPQLPDYIPEPLNSIIDGCLHKDWRQRWSSNDILAALAAGTSPADWRNIRPVRDWHTTQQTWLNAVAFNSTGTLLAIGGDDAAARLRLQQIGGRWESNALRGFEIAVRIIAFNHNGQLLSAAAADRIRIWDVAAQIPVGLINLPAPVATIALSPVSDILAASYGTNEITLRRIPSGDQPKLRQRLAASSEVRALAFRPQGDYLAAATNRGRVPIWSMPHGEYQGDYRTAEMCDLRVLCFSRSGQYLAAGDSEGRIHIWDAHSGNQAAIAAVQAHTKAVTALAFTAEGSWLISGGGDGEIALWPPDGSSKHQLALLPWAITAVACGGFDDKLLAASSCGVTKLWRAS